MAAAAEPPTDREDLIASFEELKKAVHEKIDSDIEDVAWALWSVHEIEEARRWADFFLAPLAVVQQTIATVAALKNIRDVEVGLGNASTPLGLMAYLVGVGQLEEVGTNLQLAWDGPAYSSEVRAFYDDVGKARSLQDAVRTLHLLLDPQQGPGGSISIRAPEQARARGTPGFVHRPGDVRRFVAEALNQLTRDLAAGTLEPTPPLADALRARVEQATAAIKRSKSAPLDVSPLPGLARSEEIRLGAIAGFRAAQADLLAAYDRKMAGEAVSVRVKAMKAAGSAIFLHQTLQLGDRLTTLQSSIVSLDSLAWSTVERTFPSSVRELLAEVPQEMLLALGPELTNTWLVAEEAAASIRAELGATTAAAQISDAVPGEQVEITMGDGSVLKGHVDPAKIPFVSGYGTIEVETGAIASFAESRLALEDGSVLKGAFGDGDVALTTGRHGALRIPAREIVAMNRSSASEPATEEAATKTPATVDQSGELTETQAETLIEAEILTGPPERRTVTAWVDILDTKLWTGGTAWTLTETDKCWPGDPEAYKNAPTNWSMSGIINQAKSPYFLTNRMSAGYGCQANICVEVRQHGISGSCRSFLAGAQLVQSENYRFYPSRLKIITHVVDGVEVTSIRSREGEAEATYTISWRPVDYLETLRALEPALSVRNAGQPSSHQMHAWLRKYDQGWQVVGR